MLGAEVSLLDSEFFGDSSLDSAGVSLGVSVFGVSSSFGVPEGFGVESEFGVDTGWLLSPLLFVGVLLVGTVGSIVTVGETRSKPCSSAPTEPTVATVATVAATTTPLLILKRKAFLRFISFDMCVPQSFC